MKTLKSLVVPLVFVVWLLGGYEARGLTFLVTQTNDSIEETSLSGALLKKIKVRGAVIPEPSLRGAILAANRRGGFNTILLQPKTYQLSLGGADEDDARSGDLDITRGNLTITIVGSGKATIDGSRLGDRVFQIFSDANVRLLHLRITGGKAGDGGAIYNSGALVVQDSVIVNNLSEMGGYDRDSHGRLTAVGGGGAIFNMGTIEMWHCDIQNNRCDGGDVGYGGGILNSGVARLNNCKFSGNASGIYGGSGGAIFNYGEMNLSRCVITGNMTGQGFDAIPSGGTIGGGVSGYSGGNSGDGAGIYNAGHLHLDFSSIYANTNGTGGKGGDGYGIPAGSGGRGGDGGNGGGVYNNQELTVKNSTIALNVSGQGGIGGNGSSGGMGGQGGLGGGIYNFGSLKVICSTIVSNAAGLGGDGGSGFSPTINYLGSGYLTAFFQNGDGGAGGVGGGVFSIGGMASVGNTLMAFNFINAGGSPGVPLFSTNEFTTFGGTNGAFGSSPDLSGDFTSHGFNLIGASDGSTGFTNGVNADQVGSRAAPIDPLIGPLQMNGGPTPTHALLPGSPAIDRGKNFGQKFDQRGHPRPHDYVFISNAPGGDGADIGAFERDN